MIQYKRFTLANGLRVLVHEDQSTPMVAINMCYYVGARDESPDKTGFAHLFEHLMFGGTDQVPDFDTPIQLAGGENNAFTNNDITNFYAILPAENIETALWLESDRMSNLCIQEQSLEVQRKVVIEEFKETCLNEPYGDVWHHLSDLAYKVHPYRWPTIGKIPEHVMDASLSDVQHFYQKYYQPNNAILTITGNVQLEEVELLVKKWFEPIEAGASIERKWPVEPPQENFQKRVLHTQIPTDALYLAFHIPSRVDPDFYGVDLLSDILGNGPSSRLYKRLLKDAELFSFIDCYISGTIDPGLLIIEAKPLEGVSLKQAQEAIWAELEQLKKEKLSERELRKVQNKVISTLLFSEVSILNKAINLAFFEILGNAELINQEAQLYRQVSRDNIQHLAQRVFNIENCSEVVYEKNKTMFSTLINSQQLEGIINAPNTLVIDCRYKGTGQEAYKLSHIPGAIYLHMDRDLSGPIIPGETGRHPLPELDIMTQRFSDWGIDSNKQVIVYDDKKGALAARLWWMLHYAGHTKVAVLDGGWHAWQEAKYKTEAKENKPTPSSFVSNYQKAWTLNADEIETVAKIDTWTIIDSRAAERYQGEVEPIDPIAGHIPAAINMPFAENWDENGLMKTPAALRQRFADLPKADRCVFYCGSGVTACHNILAHTHAGLGIPHLYPGSWSDWITADEREKVLENKQEK